MRIGGSVLTGRRDYYGGDTGFEHAWGFYHHEDLTHPEAEGELVMGQAEAYGILAPFSPLKGVEWWDKDRATRSFPFVVDGKVLTVTCTWEPSIIQKGDVKVRLGGEETGDFTIPGSSNKSGPNVPAPLANVLDAVRELRGNPRQLAGFEAGEGKYIAENGDWDEMSDAAPYKKGAGNDIVVMNRAAYLYEMVARFTDALNFLMSKIVRESGQRPKGFSDKMVHQFVIPVVVGGRKVEIEGRLVGKYFPLEARVETSGEVGIGGGKVVKFRGFNGGTTPNFTDDDVHFPYQEVENLVRQVEVVNGERMVGGLNNFGATRLYGKQRNDLGGKDGASLQHFLNENGSIDETVELLGKTVAILEGLRGAFEGKVGQVREEVSKDILNHTRI